MSQIDSKQLPIGARRLQVPVMPYSPSEDLAARLAAAGATDLAVDVAGGAGSAKRLRERDGSASNGASAPHAV